MTIISQRTCLFPFSLEHTTGSAAARSDLLVPGGRPSPNQGSVGGRQHHPAHFAARMGRDFAGVLPGFLRRCRSLRAVHEVRSESCLHRPLFFFWPWLPFSPHQIIKKNDLPWRHVRDTGDATALMVGAFSLLAVGTSLIGTLLGFSQFFSEQLRCLPVNCKVEVEDIAVSPFAAAPQREDSRERRRILLEDWWVGNYINLGAMSMAVIPALLVAITVPDAFYLATDIAVTIDQTPSESREKESLNSFLLAF